MLSKIAVSLMHSFISALAGWAVGVVAVVIFSGILLNGNAPSFALIVGLFSAPVILLVWLILLWPLYGLVPRSSILWQPSVCVVCGVVAGGLLATSLFRTYISDYAPFLLAAPLIGGVTCAVGCKLHGLAPGYTAPPPLSEFFAPAVLLGGRIARWCLRRFSGWSGQ